MKENIANDLNAKSCNHNSSSNLNYAGFFKSLSFFFWIIVFICPGFLLYCLFATKECQYMVNPYTYNNFEVTEEPTEDPDPKAAGSIAGFELKTPFGR